MELLPHSKPDGKFFLSPTQSPALPSMTAAEPSRRSHREGTSLPLTQGPSSPDQTLTSEPETLVVLSPVTLRQWNRGQISSPNTAEKVQA